MVIQKYTNNLYLSEVYRELERQAVRKGHFDPTPEEMVKSAASKITQHNSVNQKIDPTPSGDLLQDISRLTYALRRKGFVSQAEDIEQKLITYKIAENEFYNVKIDTPDFSFRDGESEFEVAPAKDEHGVVETIFSTQKKIQDIATKNPTGKFAKEASSPFYGVTREKNIDFINFAHRGGDVNIVGFGDLGTFETIQSAAEKIRAVTLKQPTGMLPKNASISDIAKIVLAQLPSQEEIGAEQIPTYDIEVVKKFITGVSDLLSIAASPELNFSGVLNQDGSGTYLHGDGHGAALFNAMTENKANIVINYGSLVKSLFGGKPPTDPVSAQNTIFENIKTKRINYVNNISKFAQYAPVYNPVQVQQQTGDALKDADQEWEAKAKELAPQYASKFIQAQSAAFQVVSEAQRKLSFYQADAKRISDFLKSLASIQTRTPEEALGFANRVKVDLGGLSERVAWPTRILHGFGKLTEASQLSGVVKSLLEAVDRLVEQAKKSVSLINDIDVGRVQATLGRLASIRKQLEAAKKDYGIDADQTLAAVAKMSNIIKNRYGAGNVKYLLDGLKDFENYKEYDDLDRDTIGLLEDVKRDIARAAKRE